MATTQFHIFNLKFNPNEAWWNFRSTRLRKANPGEELNNMQGRNFWQKHKGD